MNSHELVFFIPIILGTALFAMIFGIVYLKKRENLAMIERGMNPRLNRKPRSSGFNTFTLTWGLLMIGAGVGLFLAYVLDVTLFQSLSHGEDNPAIYFSLIGIFGGAGLFLAYRIEKKDAVKLEQQVGQSAEVDE